MRTHAKRFLACLLVALAISVAPLAAYAGEHVGETGDGGEQAAPPPDAQPAPEPVDTHVTEPPGPNSQTQVDADGAHWVEVRRADGCWLVEYNARTGQPTGQGDFGPVPCQGAGGNADGG